MSDQIRHGGRVGPHRESHEERLDIRHFMTLPSTVTEQWDATNGLTDWGVDHNDVYGDCGAAATDHAMMAQTGSYGQYGQLGMPKFAGTLATYFAYGVAQGEPGPQPDQGVSNSKWFAFLFTHGIIQGYAEIPLAQIDYYGQLFKGCVLGVVIDGNQAINDFQNRQPWPAMPGAQDGHDVLYVATRKVVTWGGLQDFAPGFLATNATDAWVIIDPDDPNVDGPALRAALAAVHGTIAPTGPTGPTAGPAPRPTS